MSDYRLDKAFTHAGEDCLTGIGDGGLRRLRRIDSNRIWQLLQQPPVPGKLRLAGCGGDFRLASEQYRRRGFENQPQVRARYRAQQQRVQPAWCRKPVTVGVSQHVMRIAIENHQARTAFQGKHPQSVSQQRIHYVHRELGQRSNGAARRQAMRIGSRYGSSYRGD